MGTIRLDHYTDYNLDHIYRIWSLWHRVNWPKCVADLDWNSFHIINIYRRSSMSSNLMSYWMQPPLAKTGQLGIVVLMTICMVASDSSEYIIRGNQTSIQFLDNSIKRCNCNIDQVWNSIIHGLQPYVWYGDLGHK